MHDVYLAVPEIEAGIGAGGVNDTLGLADFIQATPAVYALPTGYGTGTSHSVDTFQTPIGPVVATTQFHSFAEGYLVNDDYTVLGAMFFAGAVDVASGGNPDLTVKVQKIEDNKAVSDPATVQNPDIPGPGAVLASAVVALGDVAIDPTGATLLPTFVDFTSTPFVDVDFCISIDISNVYSGTPMDTIAIVTTADGEGDDEYTYHQIYQTSSAGTGTVWTTTDVVIATGPGSGVNVNFAMFPIVTEFVGIEEAGFFDGLKMQAYPNPGLASENITIQYAIESLVEKVEINVFDMTGRTIFSTSLGAKNAGIYSLDVPVGILNAGSYIYSIEVDGGRMAKRLEILK